MIVRQTGSVLQPSAINCVHGTSTAANPVVITFAAVANARHMLHGVQWSYTAAPTGGRLLVEDGSGNEVMDVDIIAGGPGGFSPCIVGSVNTAMIVTLASGAGAVVGKLNVQAIVAFS